MFLVKARAGSGDLGWLSDSSLLVHSYRCHVGAGSIPKLATYGNFSFQGEKMRTILEERLFDKLAVSFEQWRAEGVKQF